MNKDWFWDTFLLGFILEVCHEWRWQCKWSNGLLMVTCLHVSKVDYVCLGNLKVPQTWISPGWRFEVKSFVCPIWMIDEQQDRRIDCLIEHIQLWGVHIMLEIANWGRQCIFQGVWLMFSQFLLVYAVDPNTYHLCTHSLSDIQLGLHDFYIFSWIPTIVSNLVSMFITTWIGSSFSSSLSLDASIFFSFEVVLTCVPYKDVVFPFTIFLVFKKEKSEGK